MITEVRSVQTSKIMPILVQVSLGESRRAPSTIERAEGHFANRKENSFES